MNASTLRRPKRLWAAAILTILMTSIGLLVLSLLYNDPAIVAALNMDSYSIGRGVLLAAFLFVASCYALLGKRYGHFILLTAAALYYGALIVQNVGLLDRVDSLFSKDGEMRVWSKIVWQTLALLFVAWASVSSKTRLYFSRSRSAP